MNSPSRFDLAASQWDTNPVRVDLARAVGNAILSTIPIQPTWRVLDYGAGTGLLTLNLLPHAVSLLAVDSSAGMLEALSQKLLAAGIDNVQTRRCDIEIEPLPETGFDLIVSSMTFHHLRDVPRALKRLTNTLKPGGWLAAADLDSEDGTFHGPVQDVFHHGFDRLLFSSWFANAGLCTIQTKDVFSIPRPGAAGQVRHYGVFLCSGRSAPACPS